MVKNFRYKIAQLIAPEYRTSVVKRNLELQKREEELDLKVNQRVADYLSKMDPFEPLLKKYNIIFSNEYERVEDRLDSKSQVQLYMWAYGLKDDVNFRYLIDFIRNTQGNATVRKSANDQQWFFGRAMIASITLFKDEVVRLASHYEEIISKRDQAFDSGIPAE